MSTDQALLTAEQLEIARGGRVLLSDINFSLRAGEILAVMGPSGVGKSTMLRVLLGLQTAAAGEVHLFGEPLGEMETSQLKTLRQKLGVAYQGGALFSALSVADNVALPLRQHTKLDKATIDIMVRMKLAMLDLEEAADLMPAQLSGGMRKRAGLARALIMDPALLFFDEPSAGLDPASAARIDDIILELRNAMNMAILIITHDLESAFHVADKMVILKRSGAAFAGSPADVRQADDAEVRELLQRKVRRDRLDAQTYLDQLTGA